MNKKNLLYLFVAFLLGFIVIWNELRKVSFNEMYTEFNRIHWGWILVAFLCMLLHWGIESKIIQLFLKRTNPTYSFWTSYRIPLIEHLFNAITPFSTGGQPAQIVTMAKTGIDLGVATSVSLMKFVIYQIWIVINFIVCIILGFDLISGKLRSLTYLILFSFSIHFVIVLALLLIMYWYPITAKVIDLIFNWLKRVKPGAKTEAMRQRVFQKMDNFYAESRYMKRHPKLMIKASLLTIGQLLAYYIVPYFILLGIGVHDVHVFQVIVFHAFIILLISLFPVPGGTGGAEYSFTLLFGAFIVVKSKLILAILLWRMVTYYSGIFLGLLALMTKPKSLNS